MPWADVWKDQETIDALTRQIRATTPLRGAAEIRAVLEQMAERERRRRTAVSVWEWAKGRQVAQMTRDGLPEHQDWRDGLPEHQDWRDEGCDLHPSCLSCPLPACRYEMPPGRGRMLLEAEQLQTLLTEGKSIDQSAAIMGVSRRTVYRIRRAMFDSAHEQPTRPPRIEPITLMVDDRPACIRCGWAPKMIHPSAAFVETPRGLVCRRDDACTKRRGA